MKTVARLPFALGFAGVTLASSLASAHVRLVYPTPRYPSPTGADQGQMIKMGPCGNGADSRTTNMSRITTLEPGATITVQFNETVNHTGWFRISFDDSGQDAFTVPLSRAMVQMGPTFTLPVLLDNIADGPAGARSVMVTLPNVECENCTLQLIQVMDIMTAQQTWAADDIYYTCADIVLRRTGGGGGMGGMGTGGGGGLAGGGGMPPGGGSTGLGGLGGLGGSGGSGVDMGGVGPGGLGGATTGGSGGSPAGGVTSSGGMGTGGAPSGGTATATGGTTTTTGGSSAAGAATSGTTSAPANAAPETAEDSGCHLAPGPASGSSLPLAALALAAVAVRRRRGSRSAAA